MEKHPSESLTIMTQVVLPDDTNPLGILMGGRMMNWMDMASAVCAQRHSGNVAVTASVDGVVFKNPVQAGDIVEIKAKVTRAFTTSMEIQVEVWAENISRKEKQKTHSAYYTFVALGSDNKPVKIPAVLPATDEEFKQFEAALLRREYRREQQ